MACGEHSDGTDRTIEDGKGAAQVKEAGWAHQAAVEPSACRLWLARPLSIVMLSLKQKSPIRHTSKPVAAAAADTLARARQLKRGEALNGVVPWWIDNGVGSKKDEGSKEKILIVSHETRPTRHEL